MGGWFGWGVVGGRFERRRDLERARLLARVGEVAAGPEGRGKYADSGALRVEAGGDGFTGLLVEYYAYGLAQARTSFVTSQWFGAMGGAILLFGVGLGVWKAESSGELYVGVVTSSVGLVVTVIGQLFHRRADAALRYMADQSALLREDRQAAEAMRRAVELLGEVADPALRARLQAGLIMKLSGAELPG
ncbi:hypothetical protein ACFRSX_33090 [Streptomyces goshikiensis]|uniref:TRADD-N-associated membrane domain-containing protein n=1 Tax=Streptomyces TaxID=1883 RepID=UPI00093D9C31|nr:MULTISPECIES: hypothetical protein [Streptomyces]OKI41062.1 hypothetical protein A6A28_27615 [Streptomyces sp. CB03578]PJN14732.1 hypothetical protein CG724_32320 [Streptomyces sp. CB02120-2]GHD71956.1 hypothetical protein GCM10010336_42360 [Streptomyces goshikiensis]